MSKVKERARWTRLEIYFPDEEIRRRVKFAAAARELKLSEYCAEAILERLEQDEAQSWDNWQREVEELRAWQSSVRKRFKGNKIPDSAEVLHRMRKARTRALAG